MRREKVYENQIHGLQLFVRLVNYFYEKTLKYIICFIFISFLFIIQTNRDTEALSRTNTQSLWDYGIPTLPPSEEVTRRTEQVTRRIQELWMAMQDPHQREAFVPCAERIRVAVAELTAIFPQVIKLSHII